MVELVVTTKVSCFTEPLQNKNIKRIETESLPVELCLFSFA
jgi:hypothetical protein